MYCKRKIAKKNEQFAASLFSLAIFSIKVNRMLFIMIKWKFAGQQQNEIQVQKFIDININMLLR